MNLMTMTLQEINKSEKIISQIMMYADFNKAEQKLVHLFFGKQLKNYSPSEKKNQLLPKIMQIQAFLGIKDKYDKNHYIDLVNYICDVYGNITIEEFEIAFQLAIAQKSGDFEIINQLNTQIVAKVLNAYSRYISPIKIKLINAADKKNKVEIEKIKNENSEENIKQLIITLFENSSENTDLDLFDLGNVCYDFVASKSIFVFEDEKKIEASITAKRKMHYDYSTKINNSTAQEKQDCLLKIKKLRHEIDNKIVNYPETPDVIQVAKKILLHNWFLELKKKNEKITDYICR